MHKAKVGGAEGKVWGQGPIRQSAGLLKGGQPVGRGQQAQRVGLSHFLYFFTPPMLGP